MKITIHRANQIGGCITVIENNGCKIIIDLGCNLPGSREIELTEEELATITKDVNAIFYTHYHGDHTGLHYLVDSKIPQFIGAGAKEVMLCKYRALNKHSDFGRQISYAEQINTYQANKPVLYDGCDHVQVTPYFVSHSAFDAYMFKIECDGIKILHTGDFRKHGYVGKGLIKALKTYVGEVDLLITEGTMLGRKCETVLSESEIKVNVEQALNHKYVFALCSSTDMERIASYKAACEKSGRVFLVDGYQKEILDIFTKYAGKFSDLFCFESAFVRPSKLNEKVLRLLKTRGFLMPIRSSSLKTVQETMKVFNDEDSWLIYSMWNGYSVEGKDYTNKDIIKIRELFGQRVFDGTHDGFHTSGHADVETLEEVCTIVNPKIGVIPIHKDADTEYSMPKVKGFKIFTKSEKPSERITIELN